MADGPSHHQEFRIANDKQDPTTEVLCRVRDVWEQEARRVSHAVSDLGVEVMLSALVVTGHRGEADEHLHLYFSATVRPKGQAELPWCAPLLPLHLRHE